MFAQAITESALPGARRVADLQAASWPAAFRLLAAAIEGDGLAVMVIDELPYLIQNDPGFEGAFQRAFDRELSCCMIGTAGRALRWTRWSCVQRMGISRMLRTASVQVGGWFPKAGIRGDRQGRLVGAAAAR
ncbi:MAG: hypothetical protein ACRDNW_16115 [Trebonia sp.]